MDIRIAPSLLAADFSDLREEVSRVERGGADWLHLDVMDGLFVPNISFGPPVIASIRAHSSLPFDTHLMIRDPERYIEAFRKAGADVITIHQEACRHLHGTLSKIRDLGAKAGIAINPATPVSSIMDVIALADLVLVMTVNPGFGGQSFIEAALKKVEQVGESCKHLDNPPLIEVDGGLDESNVRRCVEAGASVIVAGTSIFKAADPTASVGLLRTMAVEAG